jgi:biotin carboxyl carrier protein
VPTFSLTIGGKVYHVEIPDPGATPLQVIVDGQTFEVDFAGAEYGVRAEPLGPPPRPAPEPDPLPAPPRVSVARPAEPVGEEYHGEVTAPMPGTILAIPVSVGERVEPGAVLCILEAMKMRNPIRATHPGIVHSILVTPGQAVAYGDLLIRLAQD